MNTLTKKKMATAFLAGILMTAAGCSSKNTAAAEQTSVQEETAEVAETQEEEEEVQETVTPVISQTGVTASAAVTSAGLFDAADFFSDRDLAQTADLSDAQYITLTDNQDVNITSEGVYVLSGTASEVTIRVEADDSAKVQLVLSGVNVTNTDSPVIYVVSADKVFVTTTESDNTMTVTGTFTADGETNTDAVIFSRDDLVFNGLGTLTVKSTDNGISCKDDLKITGGSYSVTAGGDGIEANDSVRISGGTISITSDNDGIQVENDDDNTTGYVYICGGTIDINAADDGIHGNLGVQVDGGSLSIDAAEGIEGTYVQINGGSIEINASDDGINAAFKTNVYTPTLEITGGEVTVTMGAGDTDALDSNGYIYIKGGTVNISGQSAFDYDYGAEMTGGTVYVNGSQITSITNSMMGGGMMGGMQGFGGMMGGNGGYGRP
jgi:hypothetical protein